MLKMSLRISSDMLLVLASKPWVSPSICLGLRSRTCTPKRQVYDLLPLDLRTSWQRSYCSLNQIRRRPWRHLGPDTRRTCMKLNGCEISTPPKSIYLSGSRANGVALSMAPLYGLSLLTQRSTISLAASITWMEFPLITISSCTQVLSNPREGPRRLCTCCIMISSLRCWQHYDHVWWDTLTSSGSWVRSQSVTSEHGQRCGSVSFGISRSSRNTTGC